MGGTPKAANRSPKASLTHGRGAILCASKSWTSPSSSLPRTAIRTALMTKKCPMRSLQSSRRLPTVVVVAKAVAVGGVREGMGLGVSVAEVGTSAITVPAC